MAVVSTTKVPTGPHGHRPRQRVPRRRRGSPARSPGRPCGLGPILLDAPPLADDSVRRPSSTPTCCWSAPPTRPARCRCSAEAIEQAIRTERRGGRRQPAGVPPRPAGDRRPGRLCRGRGRPDGQARRPAPATRQRSAWRRRSGRPRARSWTGWSAAGPPTWPRYQNLRYADAYAGLVRRVYQAEHAAAPGSDRAVRTGRAVPVQAHGLQGRVRGGPAVPRPGSSARWSRPSSGRPPR